jgi:hypothetical protein
MGGLREVGALSYPYDNNDYFAHFLARSSS